MSQNNDQINWIDEYEFIAKETYGWLHKASELIYAGNKALIRETEGQLKGQYQNIGIYMMLSSYAIENIIKCIIIKKNPSVVSNGKLNTSISGRLGHDLLNLFQIASINCTESEKDLLNRLSHFATVAGRYPIPKDWEDYKKSLQGDKKHRSIFISEDLNTVVEIINKLQKELNNLGIDYDVFDISYSHTKDGKTTFVERRIHPHKFP